MEEIIITTPLHMGLFFHKPARHKGSNKSQKCKELFYFMYMQIILEYSWAQARLWDWFKLVSTVLHHCDFSVLTIKTEFLHVSVFAWNPLSEVLIKTQVMTQSQELRGTGNHFRIYLLILAENIPWNCVFMTLQLEMPLKWHQSSPGGAVSI